MPNAFDEYFSAGNLEPSNHRKTLYFNLRVVRSDDGDPLKEINDIWHDDTLQKWLLKQKDEKVIFV